MLLRSTEEQLTSSKTQVSALKNKLEEVEKAKVLAEKAKDEAEKAKDETEQRRYNVRVAETEDALRAEVPAVYRTYCTVVWDEALNQAGVEVSSILRKPESIYYPSTIRPSSSSGSQADLVSSKAGEIQGNPSKVPPAANTSSKKAELAEDASGTGDANKETVQSTELPPPIPKDLPQEKKTSQGMELVLATLAIPPKKDPKDKDHESTKATDTQLPKDTKEKLVIKMKK